MNNDLSDKLSFLSKRERDNFSKRFSDILYDRYSCFKYGGMNDKEYASLPKEKIEKIKINLYEEMFNNIHIVHPSEIIVKFRPSFN